MLIEVESGTYTGRAHRHNGYFAGDFSQTPFQWSRLYTQPVVTTDLVTGPTRPTT